MKAGCPTHFLNGAKWMGHPAFMAHSLLTVWPCCCFDTIEVQSRLARRGGVCVIPPISRQLQHADSSTPLRSAQKDGARGLDGSFTAYLNPSPGDLSRVLARTGAVVRRQRCRGGTGSLRCGDLRSFRCVLRDGSW